MYFKQKGCSSGNPFCRWWKKPERQWARRGSKRRKRRSCPGEGYQSSESRVLDGLKLRCAWLAGAKVTEKVVLWSRQTGDTATCKGSMWSKETADEVPWTSPSNTPSLPPGLPPTGQIHLEARGIIVFRDSEKNRKRKENGSEWRKGQLSVQVPWRSSGRWSLLLPHSLSAQSTQLPLPSRALGVRLPQAQLLGLSSYL